MFLGAAVGALTTPAVPLIGMIAGGIAGLKPDIDSPGSTMGRRLWPVSAALKGTVKHRTIAHTVWFCLLMAVLTGFIAYKFDLPVTASALAGFLGAVTHLVLDGLTVSGVAPFMPAAWHPRGIIRTNGIADILIMFAFVFIDIYLIGNGHSLSRFFHGL
jgi:inner membrane protein